MVADGDLWASPRVGLTRRSGQRDVAGSGPACGAGGEEDLLSRGNRFKKNLEGEFFIKSETYYVGGVGSALRSSTSSLSLPAPLQAFLFTVKVSVAGLLRLSCT